MRVKRLRLVLLPFLALILISTSQYRSHAQSDVDRPSVQVLAQEDWRGEAWPGDFNRDGITDLAVGLSTGGAAVQLVVMFGHGDATFSAPQPVGSGLESPLGVGDVTGDGFIDIVAQSGSAAALAPGTGDGTFAAPVPLAITLGAPTQVLDMNADGLPDLVSKVGDRVFVHPHSGALTFATPTILPAGIMMESIIATDLNGDSLPDVATTSKRPDNRVDIFFNAGSLTFTRVDIALPADGGGITARDLNGDGITDLAVGWGTFSFTQSEWNDGHVSVLLGQGGGAFAAPLTVPTNRGPIRVVAGDFNGDGITDIATGNDSDVTQCDGSTQLLPASVSILAGRGDGSLGSAASFALGFSGAMQRLNTSDLNGDGRTDLVASPGGIILPGPPAENRPPIVDAGPDIVAPPDINDQISGTASDPDHDWLTYEWRDQFGYVIGDLPARQCLNTAYYGAVEFTLTADDGRAGVTSDTKVRDFVRTPPPLPDGFSSGKIGDVGASGRETVVGDVIQVFGSGADIWGTSDEFRFLSRVVQGDFDAVVRFAGVTNLDPWTKAGLMVRENLTPTSRHASLFGTPTAVNGVAFQRRPVDGGESFHTWGPAVAAPVWLRLVREGNLITAYTRVTESEAWALVDTQTLTGLPDQVHVGLAVTSHLDGTSARAFFSGLAITPMSTPPDGELPAGWTGVDVGNPAAVGAARVDGDTYTVQGSGADIWETHDAFHYAYTSLPADGVMTVRLADLAGPHEWAKAGLMIRQSLEPSAPHHFLLVSEANGLAHQWRPAAGDATQHTGLAGSDAPAWFRIERSGGLVRLFYALDAGTPAAWTPITEAPFPTGEVLIGLAVTSHADGLLATGTFDHVSVLSAGTPGSTWTSEIIGAVSLVGSSSESGGVYTLSASGFDIWDTADSFRYTYRTLAGDGTIVARLAAFEGVHPWSKAGVMIRASLDPAAAHGFMLLSRDNGLAFQRRTASGAATTHTGAGAATAPVWLRLTRSGSTITAAWSPDGSSWIDVDSDTLAIGSGPVLVGLALTSHDDAALATAMFDQVIVTP